MVAAAGTANIAAAALVMLAAAFPTNGTQAQNAISLADRNGIFIDGRNFEILQGKSQSDVRHLVDALSAREIGPGAIIFRAGDRLYIVDARAVLPAGAAVEPQHGQVFIAYETPKNPEHQKVYERIKEFRALEMLKQLLGPFRLPVDLEISTAGCDGAANAFFDRKGKRRTIRMCYEFLQNIMQEVPSETTAEGITPQEALVGPLFLVLLHETGHAMFDIFQVPVLGSQEDAADQFATYVLLQFGGQRAQRLLRGAAYSFKRIVADIKDKPNVTLPLEAFSSDHSRPEQRFFNMACVAYGYDDKLFAGAVDKEYLPEKRAKKCKAEYDDLAFALQRLVGPHIDTAAARELLDRRWLSEERPAAAAR
jgi:hypothetical protein